MVSDAFVPNPAAAQSYATFIGSLLHQSELRLVTVYIATNDEIASICGAGSLACYAPQLIER